MRYRIDSRRVTLTELRTELSLPMALIAWPITRLPNRQPSSSEYPTVASLREHQVSKKSQVPPNVLEEFQREAKEVMAWGFHGAVFHAIEEPEQLTSHYYVSLWSDSGETVARMKRRIFRGRTPHSTRFVTEFISATDDGKFIITSNSKGDLQTPQVCQQELLPGATAAQVWERHQRRLEELGLRGRLVRVVDAATAARVLERLHECIHQHLVARRVFVPVAESAPPSPQPLIQSVETKPEASSALSGEGGQVLDEIRRQESKQTSSPTSMALLLLVSIGLFVALGGMAWSWTFVLFLVPILLFHELGHYLCMKLFNYRNVRMFFIPLFGAAVSGQHYNVPGWKRVITSLMGPVPGILAGAALGIVAIRHDQKWLLQGALMMVGVNAFNLIPVLPLDGGWVVHGLLFSRHAFLDFIFRLATIGVLLFAGAMGGGVILYALAGTMIVALPVAFQVARITDRLRRDERFPQVHDESQIPEAAVQRISEELDRAYPKGLALKSKATLVAQIFQSINSPPPGILGTLTLGSVYLGSLVVAMIAGIVLFVGQHSDLGSLIAQQLLGPKRPLDPRQIVRTPAGTNPRELFSPETLVATFADRQGVEAAAARLHGELGAERPLVVFGTTLMLPLTAADSAEQRDAWFNQFEAEAGGADELGKSRVFLARQGEPVLLNLSCVAPTVKIAEQIEMDVAGYLGGSEKNWFVAPWDRNVELSAAEGNARRTVAAIQKATQERASDDDQDLYQQISGAYRRGRKEEVKQLQAQLATRIQERKLVVVRELRQAADAPYDVEILDAYEKWLLNPPKQPENEAHEYLAEVDMWLNGLSSKLGQLKGDEPSARALSANGAHVTRNGLYLQIGGSFESLPSGAPAVVDWLVQQGCTQFQYDFFGGFGGGLQDE